jgi:hypothetical protein
MASIPFHNETDYTLTDDMAAHIIRDAQEHFGEEAVRSIRVQSGIERHALNARTHEVRYAFSPQDFGFGHTMPIAPEPRTPEPPRARRRPPRSDEEPEADLLPAALEDVAVDAEDMEPLETSLESLDEGHDEDEEEKDDVFVLDDQIADEDDDEDDQEEEEDDQEEEDEDDNVFDPDEDEV